MIKKNNLFEKTKKELLDNLYTSKIFKIIQYGGIALISVYSLGYVFKVLAFTNNNFKILKESVKQQ
ncbi:MAG: Uncharacterised protein [Polaribacter sp. SA4-10]|nr:MAG: Uncharacterised protein [Polaribacter sp. SA4-10]